MFCDFPGRVLLRGPQPGRQAQADPNELYQERRFHG
jgi:hypothetical protein